MSTRDSDGVRGRRRDYDHHRHRRRHVGESSPKRRRSALAVETSGDGERRHLRAGDRNSAKTLVPESDSSLPKLSNARYFESRKGVSTARRGDVDNNSKIEDPSQIPRSLSYFQHDERSDAGKIGRSFGRRTTRDHQWREERDERLREGNSLWRHDGYFEQQEATAPMVRKRPAFREKKDEEKGSAFGAEKDSYGYRVREITKGRHGHKGQSFMGERRDVRRGHFSERDGHNMSVEFNTGGGKWKHDLFEDSFTARNEEEQIAKIEELLTS